MSWAVMAVRLVVARAGSFVAGLCQACGRLVSKFQLVAGLWWAISCAVHQIRAVMADEAVVKRRRVDETAVAGGTPTSHGDSASLEDVDDAELDDDLQADDLFKGSVLPDSEDVDAAVYARARPASPSNSCVTVGPRACATIGNARWCCPSLCKAWSTFSQWYVSCLDECLGAHTCLLQIPDAVASYYLQKAGFDCDDVRMCDTESLAASHSCAHSLSPSKRLIALAAQKFVADVARDAMAYCRTRSNAGQSASKSSRGTKVCLLIVHHWSRSHLVRYDRATRSSYSQWRTCPSPSKSTTLTFPSQSTICNHFALY